MYCMERGLMLGKMEKRFRLSRDALYSAFREFCIRQSFTRVRTGWNFLLFLYVSVLKYILFVYYSGEHRRLGMEKEKDYKKIVQAGKILCEDPAQPITGQIVADRLHMGYESFRKKFKNIYHISPNAYQLNYRINYAKTLLSDEQKTLEEIAVLCGFSDGFAFSKAFKKRCGISPEQFRKSI